MLTTIPGEVLTIPGSSIDEGRVGERAKRKRLMVVNHVSCRASRNDDSAGVARFGHAQPSRHTGGRTHTHSMLGGRQHGLTPGSWKPEKPLSKIDHVRRSICFCLDGHIWTTTCHFIFHSLSQSDLTKTKKEIQKMCCLSMPTIRTSARCFVVLEMMFAFFLTPKLSLS